MNQIKTNLLRILGLSSIIVSFYLSFIVFEMLTFWSYFWYTYGWICILICIEHKELRFDYKEVKK